MFATTNETIAYGFRATHKLLHRYVDDLKPAEWEHQTTPGANSVAWIVGHLTLTDRRILGKLGAADLPPLPAGFEERFGATGGAAGTHAGLGDPKDLLALFDAHRERVIGAVQSADATHFAAPMASKSGLFADVGEAAAFLGLHTALHLGQVTMVRRSLGYPPAF